MTVTRGRKGKIGDRSGLDAWLEKIQFLSDSLESTSQPFAAGHPDGRLLVCNDAFCELTGYKKEEILSIINWSADLTPPEWRGHEAGMLRELHRTGKPQRYEKEYIRRDGTRVPVELLVHPALDEAGNTLFYYSFITNITERKRAEEALRANEANLARSQAIAHLGNWELDVRTNRVRGSEELYRLFDLGPDVTLDAYIEKMHPEDRAGVVASINAAVGEGRPYNIDYRIVPRPGETRYVHAEGEVARDTNGPALKFFGTVLDITERKRAEEAMRESEGMLARSQEMAHIGSWAWDVGTGNISRSAESYRIFGLEPDEYVITYDKFLSFIEPEDRERVANEIRSATENGRPYDVTYRIRRKDGAVRILQSWGEPVKDASGRTVKMYGTNQDITERKRAEEELRKAHDDLETRVRQRTSELENANAALEEHILERQRSEKALQESEEGLRRANRALKALAKCKQAMMRSEDEAALLRDICHIVVDVGGYRLAWIGYIEDDELRTVRPVARAGYDEGYVDGLKIALNDPVTGSGPTGISLRSGKLYSSNNVRSDKAMEPWRAEALKRGYLSTLNLPLMYEGQILGTLVIYSGMPGAFEGEELGLLADLADNLAFGIQAIRDRARRDRAERELLQAKEELEARVEQRTTELKSAKEQAELYLDLMGHDINNMNQSAMGYLELALETLEMDGKIGLDGKLFIEKPLQAIQSSSTLIDNVRKLQWLMTEGIKTRPVDLHDLFEELKARDFHLNGKVATIHFEEVPHYVVGANELLKDVFFNLISNAVKHSRRDMPVTIVVKAERVEERDRTYLRCAVEDDGPGIPDELKPRLFHRFQRGKTKAHGKGLGLYIVRTLVEGYHGKVWVEDRVPGDHSKGARFVVLLPDAG